MDQPIIVFSGMPASGKDTVTQMLCERNSLFAAFRKHRAVGENDPIKDTYYNISPAEFQRMANEGCFLQYHGRYGRYYGISEAVLLSYLKDGLIPVIHIGRIENYAALCANLSGFCERHGLSVRLIHIQLWETMDELTARIIQRDREPAEIEKRVFAMRQEFRDAAAMMERGAKPFTHVIRNTDAEMTCERIEAIVRGEDISGDGYREFWEYLRIIRDEVKELGAERV